ncbi:MAG: hypothetical protein M0Q88_08540 [Bacilli bacterium]|nr:hypothetical protein [Bacilli bacterium]
MICENCGIEITSEKVWEIHLQECKKVEVIEKVEEKKEVKKTTTKKK